MKQDNVTQDNIIQDNITQDNITQGNSTQDMFWHNYAPNIFARACVPVRRG